MPQFMRALSARRRGERIRAERRKAENISINKSVDFRSGIVASLKDVRCLLEQEGVKSVIIEIGEAHLPLFNEALFSHELAGYDIQQDPQVANRFRIADKVLF